MWWHLALLGFVLRHMPSVLLTMFSQERKGVCLLCGYTAFCQSLGASVLWCPSCIKCFKEPRSQGAAVCYGRASYLPDSLNKIFRVCRFALLGASLPCLFISLQPSALLELQLVFQLEQQCCSALSGLLRILAGC